MRNLCYRKHYLSIILVHCAQLDESKTHNCTFMIVELPDPPTDFGLIERLSNVLVFGWNPSEGVDK